MPTELELACVVSQPFEENTFIAQRPGRTDCLVFDPGLEPQRIVDYLDQNGLTPAALMITHGHADHIGGNEALKARWPDCPLVIGAGDAPKLTSAELNLSAGYGIPIVSPPADVILHEGERYQAAGFDLEVREIPGHSSGHVVFVWHDHDPPIVFGGDVLFAGSVGRTDFPDGSFPQLFRGIQNKLFTLPDATIVLPGHGPGTTIGEERENNPYVGKRARQPGTTQGDEER